MNEIIPNTNLNLKPVVPAKSQLNSNQIAQIIEQQQARVRKTLKCRNCGSKQVYTLLSGVIVCRKCGYRYKKGSV